MPIVNNVAMAEASAHIFCDNCAGKIYTCEGGGKSSKNKGI
jgi:hypothetical protein